MNKFFVAHDRTATPRQLKDDGKWADIKTIGMVYGHIGAFRRLALSILRRDTSLPKQSILGKRFIASLNPKALEAIISCN